jgi:hypothetical protein
VFSPFFFLIPLQNFKDHLDLEVLVHHNLVLLGFEDYHQRLAAQSPSLAAFTFAPPLFAVPAPKTTLAVLHFLFQLTNERETQEVCSPVLLFVIVFVFLTNQL